MPNYTSLRIRPNEGIKSKTIKKRTAKKLKALQKALKKHMNTSVQNPSGHETVKIATWNLREFGKANHGGRELEERFYIAEIISQFDIVALQEVRADLKEFDKLKYILGYSWSYIATDVTDGRPGNQERMVFLYNTDKVNFKKIAGELTLKAGSKIRAAFGERILIKDGMKLNLPTGHQGLSGEYKAAITTASDGSKKLREDLEIPLPAGSTLKLTQDASVVLVKGTKVESPRRGVANVDIPPTNISGKNYRLRLPNNTLDDSLKQFARTPFLISFQSGWLKINLCTVHIYFGSNEDPKKLAQRKGEIEMLTKALAGKAEGEFKDDEEAFLGVLGDFNIQGEDYPTMEALESNGFKVPENLKSIPGSNVDRKKAYDQIAFWNPGRKGKYASLDIKGANIFDFYKHVFTTQDEAIYRGESKLGLKPTTNYKTWRTYKMSDHLPMWIELRTDFRNEYLNLIDNA